MDEQQAKEEWEYFYELENLLARFHQDLHRVQAATEAVGAVEIARYLEAAMLDIGAACIETALAVQDRGKYITSCT